MKNITFSAKEVLIEKARKKAKEENTSLNKRFHEWLERYASRGKEKEEYKSVMSKLGYAKAVRKF